MMNYTRIRTMLPGLGASLTHGVAGAYRRLTDSDASVLTHGVAGAYRRLTDSDASVLTHGVAGAYRRLTDSDASVRPGLRTLLPDFARTPRRAAASVALIAGLAAGPLAGAAAFAAPAGTPATGAVNAVTMAAGSHAAPTAGQLMTDGTPAATSQSTIDLSSTQVDNAHAIVAAAQSMHLPPRASVIAVATALQESHLNNYGDLGAANDHDSLGLFQQRPSAGWGTPNQLTDPTYAATAFLKALTQVPGWQTLPLTDAAQDVQDSAFGDRYAQWETQAANLVLSAYHTGPYANAG